MIFFIFVQLVDGVLTQDSDTFLYGATVVYKDLSTSDKVCACLLINTRVVVFSQYNGVVHYPYCLLSCCLIMIAARPL